MTLDIQVLALDRHKNVHAFSFQLMDVPKSSQFYLDKRGLDNLLKQSTNKYNEYRPTMYMTTYCVFLKQTKKPSFCDYRKVW